MAAGIERRKLVICRVGAVNKDAGERLPQFLCDTVDPLKGNRENGDIRELGGCSDVQTFTWKALMLVFLGAAEAIGDFMASLAPHAPQRAANRPPSNYGDFHQSHPGQTTRTLKIIQKSVHSLPPQGRSGNDNAFIQKGVMMLNRSPILSRRTMLAGSAAMVVLPSCSQGDADGVMNPFIDIEAALGGRAGIAAKNLATGEVLSNRGDERFAFCSTFKWLLGALILAKVDAGTESLATELPFGPDDIISHSPVLAPLVERGTMSLGDLCAATIITSDNAAANLLITHLGGPEGFTAQLRAFGDEVTRLDRMELELNEAAAGDPRDTSSPLAMLATMERFLFGDLLTPESREILRTWMMDATTGFARLRAGIPEGWLVGDKTGTNVTNMNNNLAFALPPEGASENAGPILIVSYLDAPDPFSAERNAVHAEIARRVFEFL